jgi:hypothetical protein
VSRADPLPEQPDYRQEARQIRDLAAEMKDARIRVQLLVIASLYEKLAKHVGGESDSLSDKVS